jgi:hypothetical protein
MNRCNLLKVITAVNVLVASGFAIAGVVNCALIVPSHNASDPAAAVFALYAAARAIPLAILTITTILMRRNEQIWILAIVAGCIQFADGCIGMYLHDPSKFIGPFILAAAEFLAVYMVGYPKEKLS